MSLTKKLIYQKGYQRNIKEADFLDDAVNRRHNKMKDKTKTVQLFKTIRNNDQEPWMVELFKIRICRCFQSILILN